MALPPNHRSYLVPLVGFDETLEKGVIIPFIEKYALRFFKAQEGIEDLSHVYRIQQEDMITDLDWNAREEDSAVNFEYIYRVVMNKARKKDGRTRQMAYAITFDRNLTTKECEETKIKYETMTLAGEPILYYLLMDLGDLIAKVRRHVQ